MEWHMGIEPYRKKRNFNKTPEPSGVVSSENHHLFVIQKHAASHLHYDFRLELNGVLLSWAVPKGPCFDPSVKRLAMHVEDHPLEYGYFEGVIPNGQYGAGNVMLWDRGIWKPLDKDPEKAYRSGHLRFELEAQKLKGRWDLVRFKDEAHWFLIKFKDKFARKLQEYDVTEEEPDSVMTNLSIDEIGEQYGKSSESNKKKLKNKHPLELSNHLSVSPFPGFVAPQLATLVDKAPEGSDWAHEIKFDGYRIIALIHNDHIHLKSRNNIDWTNDLVSVVDALKELTLSQAIFDGEVVLLDAHGKSDFQLLQNTIKANTKAPFIYYLFDILYYDQFDLRTLPLLKRKAILRNILEGQDKTLRFSDHIIGEGDFLFHRACELGLEGIISKQIDSPYLSGRSKRWLKIKSLLRQEFVICGYSVPTGSRKYFRALYLGVYNEQGKLDYAGNVGTGFSASSLKDIFSRLQKILTQQNPFNKKIPGSQGVVWVQPKLVAEIEFTHWTEGGHLRHPSFKGLRLDKKPEEVLREQKIVVVTQDKKMKKEATQNAKAHSFKITHPDKVFYPEDGITKKDLLNYYECVCNYMMPFINNRPLSLLRCPENWHEGFFQRHYTDSTPKTLKAISIEAKEGKEEKEPYVYLDTTEGLFSLVQMNVLEIHPWGSLVHHIEKPDFIVFDLDPGPSVTWAGIVKAAFEIRKYLDEFKLTSFVKTTGGKGLHVVVPIEPEYNWDEVKNFTQVFAEFMAQVNPDKYTSTMAKAKRNSRIFIDFLRNQRGATAIGPYSSRARIHAPVAVPIHWDELSKEKRDTEFTIKTLPKRLASLKNDPWEDYWKIKQSLRLNSIL